MFGVLQSRRLLLSCVLLVTLTLPTLLCAQDDDSRKLLERGNSELRNGNLDAAAQTFSHLTETDPKFAGGFFNLGLVRIRQGKWEEAITVLQKCIQLDPKLRGAHLFLGIADYRSNHYADAVTQLKHEIGLSPNNPDALMWLGVVELVGNDVENAVANLDKAARLAPDNVDILYHRGRAHMLLSKKSYEHMYEVDPQSWRIHQVLAQSFVEQERFEEAVRECQLAIQSQPGEPGLHEQLGDIYWKQNQLEAAETEFQNELKIDADSVSAYYKLGTISLERSQPEAAVEILRKVLTVSPESIEAHYQMGRAEAQMGKYDDAIHSFSFVKANAVRADKEILRQSYYQLSQLYRRTQKPEESKQAMQVFLSMKQESDAQAASKLQDKMKRTEREGKEN